MDNSLVVFSIQCRYWVAQTGTGEPDGLPSMESHRIGHDRSNLAAAASILKRCLQKAFVLLLFQIETEHGEDRVL